MKSTPSEFGTRCLLARRLVERGVRFVQIYSGGGPVSVQWDAHSNLVENHEKMSGMTDLPSRRPAAGSKTARIAGRHAGNLGRGVRAPADVARRQRPRSQSARLHHVVRRRRRKAGHPRSARPTNWACAPRQALAHARFPRHHPASAGPGSKPPLVPAQRPQRKAHRLRRQRIHEMLA